VPELAETEFEPAQAAPTPAPQDTPEMAIETMPQLPDASDLPDVTQPAAPAMLDITHIPDDPTEDAETADAAPNILLAGLREMRKGGAGQNKAALGEISTRLHALKIRMHRERRRENQL